MVVAVTWQLLYHAVGHSIMAWRLLVLQAFHDSFHLITNDFFNIGFELSITKSFHSSPDLSVMIA